MSVSPLAVTTASAQDQSQYPSSQSQYPSQGQYPPQGQPSAGDGQQPDYNGGQGYGPPPAYSQGYDPNQYGGAPPPPPPPGYNGDQPPPPPPGYNPSQDSAAQQAQDAQFAAQAQAWAQANCVKAHGNAGEGALLGGLFGAVIGSGLAGRGSHGEGALAGAAVGAAGGAVIASNTGSNATSPGCPPGYVLRDGAAPLYYGPAFAYAAPGWYHPWVYYGGAWVFRPYPYHVYYYRHYYRR